MSCCSGSSFTPAPDAALDVGKRVNFTFGMVLGVDDFRQEHSYLAARDARALRESIGYGVVSGLDVSTDPLPPSSAAAVSVRVTPGVAMLPDGNLVGVAADQCASLTDWLAGPNKKPSDVGGDCSVYVVLRFAENAGTPVPIPGEPCRDESSLQADSRIADSFSLDFSWQAPSSREDDALRCFAVWLRTVPVHAAPASAPDIAAFQKAVEDAVDAAIKLGWPTSLDPPLAATPAATAAALVIPQAHYAEYINAAFDVWIRRLRATYQAKHGPVPAAEAAAENGLLLAAIDVTLTAGQFARLLGVRWLGRAQLAHLRLLQEWLLTKADDAPRDAHYVLGKADPRLPRAQDLHAAFEPAARRLARVDIEGGDGLLQPATVWPGDGVVPADYYGPGMSAPIPVGDGGTGQSVEPAPGQLLVGAPTAVAERAFVLGELKGATHSSGGDATESNIRVDVVGEAPDIVLDTVQDIDPQASPSFAGLSISGAVAAGSLAVSGTAAIAGNTTIGGDTTIAGTTTLTGSLSANGGITTTALGITGLAAGVVGSDSSGKLLAAKRWDGIEASIAGEPSYYYAPGQGHAVRIPDGGTGLSARPAALQVLVGRNDSPATPAYVLATLQAGSNVELALNKVISSPPGPRPLRREEWTLSINAKGGSDLALPLLAKQGGTGQEKEPGKGQILIGDGNGAFALGEVVAAGSGLNLTVESGADAVTLNTVQDLHAKAVPTFEDLLLSNPPDSKSTHGLAWNSETRAVVRSALPGRGVRVLKTSKDFPRKAEDLLAMNPVDQVLVYAADVAVKTALPPPAIDGQMLIVKLLSNAGSVVLEDNGSVDLGAVGLEKGQSLSVVASLAIGKWLVVGRS